MSTRTEITKAIRVAMKTSLLFGGKYVDVAHPLFAEFRLSCKREYLSQVQRFPSTAIRLVKWDDSKRVVWSTTAAYLPACIDHVVRDGKVL